MRAHKDAMPEMQELAKQMLLCYTKSVPKRLACGEWHLPFADKYLIDDLTIEELLKIVAARCARVSYKNFLGDIDYKKDYKLHDDLLRSGHMSPFEHAAKARDDFGISGNFIGFDQYRKMLVNENREHFDPQVLLLCQNAKYIG